MHPKIARAITRSLNQLLLSATHENVGDLKDYSLLELTQACQVTQEHYPKENIPSERRVAMLYLLLDRNYHESRVHNVPNMTLNGTGLWLGSYDGLEMRVA